jgi:hypothetical protein
MWSISSPRRYQKYGLRKRSKVQEAFQYNENSEQIYKRKSTTVKPTTNSSSTIEIPNREFPHDRGKCLRNTGRQDQLSGKIVSPHNDMAKPEAAIAILEIHQRSCSW